MTRNHALPGIASLLVPGVGQLIRGKNPLIGLAWLVGVMFLYSLTPVVGLIAHAICIHEAASEKSETANEP